MTQRDVESLADVIGIEMDREFRRDGTVVLVHSVVCKVPVDPRHDGFDETRFGIVRDAILQWMTDDDLQSVIVCYRPDSPS